MSVQEDDIIVEIGDSSIAKLAKALGGGSGGGSEGGKKGVGGIAGMLQKITGGFAGGLAKVALITTGITGIFGLVKTIVGASPMLKQILKLFNFGIMLILRPIGDFIGFFFRPIIVMLLRNLIIPFYKDILPRAQELGAFLGGGVAAFFEEPAKFIAEGLSGLNKFVTDGLVSIFSGEVNWTEIGDTIKTGMLTVLSSLPVVIIAEGIASVIKQIDWSQIAADWDAVGVAFKNWFDNGIASIKSSWNSYWLTTYVWFIKGIGNISATWNDVWLTTYEWYKKGIASISATWNDIWSWIKDWIWNGLQSAVSGIGSVLPFANGGMINEPIFGIGKSGQAYTFGERGAEMVTPLSGGGGGGTTVNITVGSISSESDMREFERRVLDVIENANSRRGRL